MKTQHTQGGWNYYLDQDSENNNTSYENGWFRLCSNEKPWIGQVQFWPNDDISKEEAEANAKLIAAAPDLLKSLQETQVLLHTYLKETPIGEKFNRISTRLKHNLKAIKKATE